jgi:hypothetical protein
VSVAFEKDRLTAGDEFAAEPSAALAFVLDHGAQAKGRSPSSMRCALRARAARPANAPLWPIPVRTVQRGKGDREATDLLESEVKQRAEKLNQPAARGEYFSGSKAIRDNRSP